MNAAVGAALKKIAVALLTDKNVLKKVISVIAVLVIALLSPAILTLSVFERAKEIDWTSEEIQQSVITDLSDKDIENLQAIDTTLNEISKKAEEEGKTSQTEKIKLIYFFALTDKTSEPDFVSRLVGCFFDGQSDEDLIRKINDTFEKEISVDEFKFVMENMKEVIN